MKEPEVRCNHWPGQRECDVCGMGKKEPPIDASLRLQPHQMPLLERLQMTSNGDPRIIEAAKEIARLRVEVLAEKAAMLAVCRTAGGHVEGHVTGPHNILGRIRELVQIERHYLFPSQMDRYPEG